MDMKNLSFEQAMERLEEIVRVMEKGDAPLDASLQLFEEGTALIGLCTGLLDGAEQKVLRLKKGADGAPMELPFEESEA